MKAVESYPLSWPEGWKRTPKEQRRNLGSNVSLYRAARSLYEELRKLGAQEIILSTNVPVRNVRGGDFSFADKYSGDAGAAVYFKFHDKPMSMACDHYFWVAQNVRGLALTIEAMRSIERHGASDMLERAFKGFTALPENAGEYWREVLQIPAEQKVTAADIETAFKRLAHVAHPDKGGTVEQWHQLNNARQNALRDIGAAR